MERVKQVFRRFLLWIGAAGLLLGLSACGHANADTYAMPTDVERLFTTASQLEAEPVASQDTTRPAGNYVWHYASEDGNLAVSVDAPVVLPDAPLSMCRVSAAGFTQAQITGIFQSLFQGKTATTIIGDNVQTKAELQSQLEKMQQSLSDGTYSQNGFSKAEYEDAIRQQEEATRNAPAASAGETVSSDGTMLSIRDERDGDYLALQARTSENDTLDVRSYPADHAAQLPSSFVYSRGNEPNYSMRDAVSIASGDTLPQSVTGMLALSFDEAKRRSDALLSASGTDLSLYAAYVVTDRQAGDTDGIVQDASHAAYAFYYLRNMLGLPVAADCWTDASSQSGFPWDQELIMVIVDDAGIAEMRWNEPISSAGSATSCASTLSFSQAQEIFEKMIPLVYGKQTTSANPKLDHVKIDIAVSQAQLCLLRVKDSTAASKSGLLVPAWVFYGDILSQAFWKDGKTDIVNHRQGMEGSFGSSFSQGPTIVFALNAVDGSVIDVSKGY